VQIRSNLQDLAKGLRVKPVLIGNLTDIQLDAINRQRLAHGNPLAPVIAEVIFFGSHIFKSRVKRDCYTIEDVLAQIESALDSRSIVIESLQMTAMENPVVRLDAYGNKVRDRAIFECTLRHPRPELFSVIPKGDILRPPRK